MLSALPARLAPGAPRFDSRSSIYVYYVRVIRLTLGSSGDCRPGSRPASPRGQWTSERGGCPLISADVRSYPGMRMGSAAPRPRHRPTAAA
eukprot:1172255-Prorocentrum_minimum.AAC.1